MTKTATIETRHYYEDVEVATLKNYAPRIDRSETFLRVWVAKRDDVPAPLVEVPTSDGRTVKYYSVSALDAWVAPILEESAERLSRGVGRPRKS